MPALGIRDLRCGDAIVQLARPVLGGVDLFCAVRCCGCTASICALCARNLALLRRDLFVLRLDLILEHAVVALGLIELLRGGRLLGKQPLRALVDFDGHLELGSEGAALSDGRIALRRRGVALGGEDVESACPTSSTREAVAACCATACSRWSASCVGSIVPSLSPAASSLPFLDGEGHEPGRRFGATTTSIASTLP